jgi:hypothetical protein
MLHVKDLCSSEIINKETSPVAADVDDFVVVAAHVYQHIVAHNMLSSSPSSSLFHANRLLA